MVMIENNIWQRDCIVHGSFEKSMKKTTLIYFLLALISLSACNTGKKLSKDQDSGGRSLKKGLSEIKQHQFDQDFFVGIDEKLAGNYQNALRDFEAAAKTDNNSASAYYEIANADVELSKIDDAEKASERAVTLDKSQNKWYLLQLSDIYRFEKKWDKAAGIYQKLITNEPDNPEYYFRLAAIYEAGNNSAEAIKEYDRIDKKFGPSEEVALQKHKLYVNEGKYDKAVEILNKLIEDDPDETSNYQLLAETWLKAGNEAKALEVYNNLLKKNPDDGQSQLALAEFYYQKGDHTNAFDMLKKAFGNSKLAIDQKIKILYNDYLMQPNIDKEDKDDEYILAKTMVAAHPADAKSHAIYGDIFYLDKKYDSARIEYRRSLETKKDIFSVWQQLLQCDAELKDYRSLADESEKALELFPSQPIVYFMDGVSNLQLKNYKKAAEVLESGLNQVADNKDLELEFDNNLAEAYYRMHDYAKSDMYFEKVLDKDPNNTLALNNYAYYLSVRNERMDKAEAMSKKSLEKEPHNASYLDTYGWILYQRGKYEEAAKYIIQSLDIEKDNAEVNEHYGDVEYKLGKVDTAVEYWKKAKQYGSDSPNLDKKISNQKIVE